MPNPNSRYPKTGCRTDKLLNALWLCDEGHLKAWVNTVIGVMDRGELKIHIERSVEIAEGGDEELVQIQDGIARVHLNGPLTKYQTSFTSLFGGTSMLQVKEILVRKLMNDPKVRGVFMEYDSPGGTADGTAELADAIRRVNAVKPVFAHAQDTACSGALWLSTQARRLTCGPTAAIGSLGAKTVLLDTSKKYEGAKVKPVVISVGEFKAMFEEGQEVKEEHLNEVRRILTNITDAFKNDVVTARKLNDQQVKEVTTARIYIGPGAQEVGLVDAVCSTDEAFEQARRIIRGTVSSGPSPSATTTAAHRSTKMALNDSQLAQARALTGNANLTAEDADVALLGAATILQQRIPQPPDASILQQRLELANEEVDLMVENEVMTSAQGNQIKAQLCHNGAPVAAMLMPGPNGKPPYKGILAAFREQEPGQLTKPATGPQPAPRSEPGEKKSDDNQVPSYERANHLRAMANLAPLSPDEYRAMYGVTK